MVDLVAASPFAQALGRTLVQFLWQGAAIAIAVAVLLFALRRSSAQARYLVAVAGLAAMTAAPVLTLVGTWSDRSPDVVINLQLEATDAAATAAAPSIPSAPSTFADWLEPRLPFIVVAWLAGVVLLAMRLAGDWWRLLRIARRATPIVQGRLAAALPAIAARIGVRRRVRLVESALVRVPSVIGWLRPAIVLPLSALAGLPPAHLDAILAHELAHIRRGDFAVNVLQCVVETLLFYHPAVWWVSRRVRVEREQCCDDLAAALSPTRVEYARALTSLEELQHDVRPVAVAASGGELLQRIRRILEPPAAPGSRWSGGVAMVVVLTVLLMSAGGQTLPASDLPLPSRVETLRHEPAPQTSIEPLLATPALPPVSVPIAPAPARAQAQTPAGSGTITGTVRDADGGLIPGATVIVTQIRAESGGRGGTAPPPGPVVSSGATTDVRGSFTIGNLVPGQYELSISLMGFKTARHTFTIAASQTMRTEVRLQVGALHESVVVRSPTSTQPSSSRMPWPTTPADYFDAAKMYYAQGRLADAEAMTTKALELLRRSMSEAPAAPAPEAAAGGPIRVGGSIRAPQRLSGGPPVYPADAAAAGIEGMVIVEAIVDQDGAVKDAKVLRSVPGLDQAALDAVRKWRFTPTLLNNKPVEIVMTVDISFVAK